MTGSLTRSKFTLIVDLLEDYSVADDDNDEGKNKHGRTCEEDVRWFLPLFGVGAVGYALFVEPIFRLEWRRNTPKDVNLRNMTDSFIYFDIKTLILSFFSAFVIPVRIAVSTSSRTRRTLNINLVHLDENFGSTGVISCHLNFIWNTKLNFPV